MASLTQWTWVWVNSGSLQWTGKPGMLHTMGLQRAGHDWAIELNWRNLLGLFSSWISTLFLFTLPSILSWSSWMKVKIKSAAACLGHPFDTYCIGFCGICSVVLISGILMLQMKTHTHKVLQCFPSLPFPGVSLVALLDHWDFTVLSTVTAELKKQRDL